jgi:hypothetical protein
MGANSEMETFFAGDLYEIPVFRQQLSSSVGRVILLVCADSGRFESLRTQLFVLVGNHMDTKRKFVNICTLATKVEDSDLWIGNTAVETTLGIGLFVSASDGSVGGCLTYLIFAVTVASCWSSGHCDDVLRGNNRVDEFLCSFYRADKPPEYEGKEKVVFEEVCR